MKTLIHKYGHDAIIILVAIIIGMIIMWFSKPDVIVTEPAINTPLTDSLRKQNDSLRIIISLRDKLEIAQEKASFVSDSILIMNTKSLKKDYEKLSVLDDSTRNAYIVERLISKGIRK